jgi:hypothetical protein
MTRFPAAGYKQVAFRIQVARCVVFIQLHMGQPNLSVIASTFRIAEAARHDANYREVCVINAHGVTENPGIAVESFFPNRIAKDDGVRIHSWRKRRGFLKKIPAYSRFYAERAEKVGTYGRRHNFNRACAAFDELIAIEARGRKRDLIEGMALFSLFLNVEPWSPHQIM